MTISSFAFTFRGFSGDGHCHLTIRTASRGARPTVVCSQKRNYSGTSITNGLERIARKLYQDVALRRLSEQQPRLKKTEDELRAAWKNRPQPVRLQDLYGRSGARWIEHYPAGTGMANGESFREVLFDAEDAPLWQATLDLDGAVKEFGADLVDAVLKSSTAVGAA